MKYSILYIALLLIDIIQLVGEFLSDNRSLYVPMAVGSPNMNR